MARFVSITVACLTLILASCDRGGETNTPPPDGVLIKVGAVVPQWFQQGHALQCEVDGEAINDSKYHVTDIEFDAGDVHLAVKGVRAGGSSGEIVLATVNLAGAGDEADQGFRFRSCGEVAQHLQSAANTQPPLDCDMAPNVPEGDCQKLTSVAIALKPDDVQKLRDLEDAEAKLEARTQSLQQLPLSQGLGQLLAARQDNLLVDFLIRTDAKSWFMNRYDEGSAEVTSRKSDSLNGDTILHATFTYVGGTPGWVNVRLHTVLTDVPCLEFEDTGGTCNPLRMPASMNEPPPPPPPPAAAPQAPADGQPPSDSTNSDSANENKSDTSN